MDPYASKLFPELPPDTVGNLQRAHARSGDDSYTTATWHTRSAKGPLRLHDLASLEAAGPAQEVAIIIQNVDLSWIRGLAHTYGIPPTFFARHAQNPRGSDVWSAVLPPVVRPFDNVIGSMDAGHFWHVDGVCTWETKGRDAYVHAERNLMSRPRQWTDGYGLNAATTLSAWMCRRRERRIFIIVLLLIDEPLSVMTQKQHCWPQYCLPLSRNRGGLIVPTVFYKAQSLRTTLEQFFSHSWHYNAIVPSISATTFWYLVISSTWSANLQQINQQVKHVAFEEIRHPSIATNSKLHDFRRDLDLLQDEVQKAGEWMPASVTSELKTTENSGYVSIPQDALAKTWDDSKTLEKFLMDSFSLLLSSIGVLEASIQATQSKRTQQLTTLAFVYAPLSFVTGIFGMNVAEINGSLAPFWVPIATGAAILALTLTAWAAYSCCQQRIHYYRWFRSEAPQAIVRLSQEC